MDLTRRHFLESAAIAGLAAHQADGAEAGKASGMPTRILGKTGARVSIVAMGCGSRLLAYGDEEKGQEALHRALDLGISYLDSAYSYGNGKSEQWVGKVMQTRRKGVWLTTKVAARKGDEAMRIIEGSLKRLQTDQVDLIHIHSLLGPEDLAAVEAKDGVLQALYKVRDQKLTRFIGVTSHTDPATLKTALERHDFDCTQMALNAAMAGMSSGQGGMKPNRQRPNSFEEMALPVARKKKMGVTAMKIFAQEGLVGAASIDNLIRYSLTLPVAAAVLGMPKLEYLEQNVGIAKAFKPLSKSEKLDLAEKLSREHKARLDARFAVHADV